MKSIEPRFKYGQHGGGELDWNEGFPNPGNCTVIKFRRRLKWDVVWSSLFFLKKSPDSQCGDAGCEHTHTDFIISSCQNVAVFYDGSCVVFLQTDQSEVDLSVGKKKTLNPPCETSESLEMPVG